MTTAKRLLELLGSESALSSFAQSVKTPLRGELLNLLLEYPDPTRENTFNKNSLAWMDIRDEYLSHEENPDIRGMAKVFFDVIICENEGDSPYKHRIDVVVCLILGAYLDGKLSLRWLPPAGAWSKDHPVDLEEQARKLRIEIAQEKRAGRDIDLLEKQLGSLIREITRRKKEDT